MILRNAAPKLRVVSNNSLSMFSADTKLLSKNSNVDAFLIQAAHFRNRSRCQLSIRINSVGCSWSIDTSPGFSTQYLADGAPGHIIFRRQRGLGLVAFGIGMPNRFNRLLRQLCLRMRRSVSDPVPLACISYVICLRTDYEVVRSHTWGVVASVSNIQMLRDRANGQFIRNAVSGFVSPRWTSPTHNAHIKQSVTCGWGSPRLRTELRSEPQPTPIFALLYCSPESLDHCRRHGFAFMPYGHGCSTGSFHDSQPLNYN